MHSARNASDPVADRSYRSGRQAEQIRRETGTAGVTTDGSRRSLLAVPSGNLYSPPCPDLLHRDNRTDMAEERLAQRRAKSYRQYLGRTR